VVVFRVIVGSRSVSHLCRLGVESGRLDDLIDPRLGGWFSRLVVARLTGIALLCNSELLIRILSKQFLLK
jgi:hypothetical protein